MPIVTASASNGTLQNQGYTCWHRIIPNDNVEGTQGADWLARTGAKKVYVLNDLSTYGAGVAATMAKELKAKGVQVITNGVDGTTTKNYGPIAQTIAASGADALFYGGYDAQAALLAKALQAAGFKGRTVSGNGAKDSVFTKNAGPAGNGWYFTCGCQDATGRSVGQGVHCRIQGEVRPGPVDLLARGVRRGEPDDGRDLEGSGHSGHTHLAADRAQRRGLQGHHDHDQVPEER